MNTSKNESLTLDIYKWCNKNGIWDDIAIYFDGKCWCTLKEWNGKTGKSIGDNLYEYDNMNPLDNIEYANPNTITMTFEGGLYSILNAYCEGWTKLEEQFANLFKKYGYYYEMGYAWSLAAYEI